MNINQNYLNLKDNYLFAEIARKVKEFKAANPDKDIIRLGIGDVTLPLAPVVVDAMKNAAIEMGDAKTFRGYDDNQGYDFLKSSVAGYYAKKGVSIDENEIFICDGAKSDTANILDIFGADNAVVIPDPVYPVYADTNIMVGREASFIDGNIGNTFLPMPDTNMKFDIVYLCSPNNPTGAVYNKEQLKIWVDYANSIDAIILFDSAYEAYVCDDNLPTSIFQIEGAKKCAIEFCSLSKTAGFTGTRCGYTIVPQSLVRNEVGLNKLWRRRQGTKFNGVSYIVQRGAEAVFSEEGQNQTKEGIAYYMQNAKIISDALSKLGIWYSGGKNSPYIWLKCPNGLSSWEFFDLLLTKANVVGTPGAGFGANGEGFFRLTSFGDKDNIIEAMKRITDILK